MIRAHFRLDEHKFIWQVSLTGHADYTEKGIDPLCAAVTGMVTLVANTLSEVIHLPVEVCAPEDGVFSLTLPPAGRERAQDVLNGLKVQLQDYQAQYPDHISVTMHD